MSTLLLAPDAAGSPYQRWSPTLGRMVNAHGAKGFSVAGFEGARLFTAIEVDQVEGHLVYRAYEGHAGMGLGVHHRMRPLCEEAARREMKRLGSGPFQERVADVLRERQGGAS